MVAKITIGSGLFGALKYNANKVNEGKGQIPTRYSTMVQAR